MNTITAMVASRGCVCDVVFSGEKILSVEKSDKDSGLCVDSALFEIQANGYGGRTCRMTSEEDKVTLSYMTRIFREMGIGWWIPTLTTASREVLETAFMLCAEVLDKDADIAASIPGLHLEGPYISPVDGPRGAHPKEHVRPPDWDEFQHLQEVSGGRIKYVTLAPEVEGAIEFIGKAVASGVVVSAGHSDLDREDMSRAVDAGLTMGTHLGNGAHDMIQRHNNYIWYQLANRNTYASFVTDGQHLPDECLYSMICAKGLDLSIITSDCVSLAGMKPGLYGPQGEIEKLPSGRLNLVGTTNLAGSASNLLECLENVVRVLDCTPAEVWCLASQNPARMLGLDGLLGVEEGKEASLTVYREKSDGKIDVIETWVAGRKVFDAESSERVVILNDPVSTFIG
ncbi:MAG: amidohydrolase family protein [Kiritimatiellae bacterium]|nr:amidohydrolase family protein [Kiritimatiellia bacterium]